MSVFGSLPGATRTFCAAAVSRSSSASATSSTTSATEIAMHRSPAAPNAAPVRCVAARSRSASASTTAWFFAPPRACTRLPCAVAVACTCCAIGVDPTNDTAAMSGCVSSASTATRSPCTTEKTPSGSPAAFHIRASKSDADGSRSDGLSTNALPVAMAIGDIHSGTIAGKLNGVMPATTPSGSRNENTSTPVAAWSVYSPLSSCGMPHAYSMTSSPRPTSPSESAMTLPCSAVIIAASSSVCCTICSRNANSTRGPLRDRLLRPALRRCDGGRDSVVDVGLVRQQHPAGHLPGRRVEHVLRPRPLGRRHLPPDDVADERSGVDERGHQGPLFVRGPTGVPDRANLSPPSRTANVRTSGRGTL